MIAVTHVTESQSIPRKLKPKQKSSRKRKVHQLFQAQIQIEVKEIQETKTNFKKEIGGGGGGGGTSIVK